MPELTPTHDTEIRETEARELYRRVFDIVVKRRWSFILSMAIAVGIVLAYLATAPRIYEAHASIIIYSATPQVLGGQFRDVVDVEMGTWWSAREYIQTQYDVLRSESLAQEVARRLDKAGKLGLLGVGDSGGSYETAARIILGSLQVEPIKESRTVIISARFRDPEVAALLANEIARTYRDQNFERRIDQTRGSAKWLSDQLNELKAQLEKSEMALYEFKKTNNVLTLSLADSANILSNEIKRLSEAASEEKTHRIQAAARRKILEGMRSSDPLDTPNAPSQDSKANAASDQTLARLKELYLEQSSKLVEMKGKYLEGHPAVVQQEARVEAVRAELRREAERAYKAVDAEYNLAVETEKNLSAALEQAKQEAIGVNRKEIEYDRLKRSADNNAKLYDLLLGRLKDTGLASQLNSNNVRVLDDAHVPTGPVSPRVPIAIAMAVMLGLVGGLALALLLDFMDNTVKSQADIEASLGIPFLGLIPRMEGEGQGDVSKTRPLQIFERPKSAVAECCRAIRTNILFMSPDRPLRTILVTSSGPQEGKSTTSINLAVTMAVGGNRVLLIDTDLRRPRLHRAFGVPAEHGMSTLILGESRVEDVVKSTQVPNLWIIPCGPLPPNPAELLHASRFKEIMAELSERYDRLVFDSPPLNVVTDAAVLSARVDGTVLVARSERTTRDMLSRARRQLHDIKAPILGCILNEVDLSGPDGGKGYYYYRRYGYYYGEGEGEGGTADSAAG
jgi:capsular exopolysaccharide synthesis family protein